jgi:hypothetical protein
MDLSTLLRLWRELSPWIQGLFGGAGAILLWEAVLKPIRERRALAHILAEEIAHNLQYAAGQRLYLEGNPKGLPGDFRLSMLVFSAVAHRIGELPHLTGDTVLLYRRVDALNALPEKFAQALRDLNDSSGDSWEVRERKENARKESDTILTIYRQGLEKVVEDANAILPRLRAAARPWYRVDYMLRKKQTLDLQDMAGDVMKLLERNRRARGG